MLLPIRIARAASTRRACRLPTACCLLHKRRMPLEIPALPNILDSLLIIATEELHRLDDMGSSEQPSDTPRAAGTRHPTAGQRRPVVRTIDRYSLIFPPHACVRACVRRHVVTARSYEAGKQLRSLVHVPTR